jgi:hypothetical protein
LLNRMYLIVLVSETNTSAIHEKQCGIDVVALRYSGFPKGTFSYNAVSSKVGHLPLKQIIYVRVVAWQPSIDIQNS